MTRGLYNSYALELLLPLVAAWALSLISGRFLVPWLHRLHVDQTEREDGPESHKKKGGTPTMGGVIFLIPMLVVTSVAAAVLKGNGGGSASALAAVMIPTAGFALIGFIDDYIKVVRHKNLGLRAWQKLLLQTLVTVFFALWLHFVYGTSFSEMAVPFAGVSVDLGILAFPALLFIALATTNGTNLTDGVDGLCASVTVPVALFLAVGAMMTQSAGGQAAAAMAGALLGYLFYNFYPAKIFMGDTGSLGIGGFVVGMTYVLKLPLFIPIIGFIYAAEVVSDILQVGYFKATHGKRLFKMAPIHHHFEKSGWSETKVVGVFTTITVILCLAAFAGLSLGV